jgi:hypothetical protein
MISGQPTRIVIDTGAEVNIIGKDWAPRVLPHLAPIQTRDVTGHTLPNHGMGELELTTLDGTTWSMVGVITEGRKLLLGLPFLRDNRAALLVYDGWLRLGDRHYQCTKAAQDAKQARAQALLAVEKDKDPVLLEMLDKALKSCSLSSEEQVPLRELLWEFQDLWEYDRIGRSKVLEHQIHLVHSRPLACKPRRFDPEQKVLIEKEIEAMSPKESLAPRRPPTPPRR